MASKRIRRLVELILDGSAARKTEKDTQESLDKATNTKKAERNLSSLSKKIGDGLKTATKTIAAAGAAVVGYGVALAKLAERGGQVIGVQTAFTRKTGDAAGALNTLREATTGLINDYDLMVGFNRAATLGAAKTAEEYGELAKTGITLGRALGVDAAFAVESLSIGIGRQSKLILDNLGLIVDAEGAYKTYAAQLGKTVDQLTQEERATAFRNATLESARQKVAELGGVTETAADQLTRFKVGFANLRDAVAQFIAKSDAMNTAFFEAGNILETLELAVRTGDMSKIKEAFKNVGLIAGHAFAGAFFGALTSAIETLFPNLTKIPALVPVLGLFTSVRDLTKEAADGAWETTDALIEQNGALRRQLEAEERLAALRAGKGGEAGSAGTGTPDAPADPAALEELRKAQDARIAQIIKATELGVESRAEQLELVRVWMQSTAALREGNQPLEERIRLMERAKSAADALGVEEVSAFRDVSDQLRPGIHFPGKDELKPTVQAAAPSIFPEDSAAFTFFIDNLEEVTSAAQVAALGIQQSFEDAFGALFEEGEGFEKFFETIFRGMAASALGALAEIAAGKVAENVAYAVEALAKGLLFGDPKALAAAAVFAKSAALWAVVGGITGAAAKAAGGGGGGSRPGANPAGREADKIDRSGPDIVIRLDGVDPSNPRHQRLIGETSKEYQSRYGGRVRMEGR